MGKSFSTHFLKKETLGEFDAEIGRVRTKKHWACGEVMVSDIYRAASEGVEPTCPKCSAFWAEKQLKGRADLRLEPVEKDRWSDFRSIYRAFHNGDLIGWVTIKSGWGNPWTLSKVGIYDGKACRGDVVQQGFHSKSAALLAIPKLREEGKLPTFANVEADQVALHAKLRDRRVTAAEKAQAEREARKLTIETLEKMAADTARFSNLERNSLLDAIERLNDEGRDGE